MAGGWEADGSQLGYALGCVAYQSHCCPFSHSLSMTPPPPFPLPPARSQFMHSWAQSPPTEQAHPCSPPSSWTQPPASSSLHGWSLMLGAHGAPATYCEAAAAGGTSWARCDCSRDTGWPLRQSICKEVVLYVLGDELVSGRLRKLSGNHTSGRQLTGGEQVSRAVWKFHPSRSFHAVSFHLISLPRGG